MRRRAAEVSLEGGDERLPLPEARDEIHALGQTLNEMLDRLRDSFEREREFVADASHELRTPVAVIKAELEAALRADDLGPQRARVAGGGGGGVRQPRPAGRGPAGAGSLGRRPAAGAPRAAGRRRPARERARALRRPGGRARTRDPRWTRRGPGDRGRPAAPAPGAGQPRRQRAALRRGRGGAAPRAAAGDGAELEVSDSGPGFGALGDRAFERFVRGDDGPHAGAPAWAWRSCARWPRPTVAARPSGRARLYAYPSPVPRPSVRRARSLRRPRPRSR